MAGDDSAMSESVRVERLQTSVQQLLDLCAENEIQVPDELKESLLTECLLEAPKEEPILPVQSLLKEGEKLRGSDSELEMIRMMKEINEILQADTPNLDLRIRNGSYTVTNYESSNKDIEEGDGPRRAKQRIRTVETENPLHKLCKLLRRCVKNRGDIRKRKEETIIMDGVNLVFEPGKMYLVLGAPGSGKSTLLKYIADTLFKSKDHIVGGTVSLTGVSPGKDVIWSNLVAFIDQIDRLHPFLTVYETCKFAWDCRTGGTHRKSWYGQGPEVDKKINEMDEQVFQVNKVLEAMGLARVKDTFVGDQERVRGVSGGEKKRVTVSEMLCVGSPVICCDEISTGLDAATTFDITRLFGAALRLMGFIKVVSLLQPPPETVANFDELILMSDGQVIYSGPVDQVIDYFNSLGYEIPDRMDVADWLQALPTKEGYIYLKEAKNDEVDKEQLIAKHLSTEEFREMFYASAQGKAILERLDAPVDGSTDRIMSMASQRYANSSFQSFKLLVNREVTLWWRDKYQIKAKFAQSLIMGTVVGTLFFQSHDNPAGIVSVLFQSMFFVTLGAMVLIIKQFPDRSIYYKQQDSNFFPTWTYVAGRSIASIPTACIDAIMYGTMIYFLVGMASANGASVAHYFVWLALLFSISLTSGLFFSIFSAAVETVTIAQACMAVMAVILVLFSGFTVQPDVIPNYYIWIYWLNMFAWVLRGLAVNEFDTGAWDTLVNVTIDGEPTTVTQGEIALAQFGFVDRDGVPYTFEWAGWGVLFAIAWAIVAMIASSYLLRHKRFATGKSLVTDQGTDEIEEFDEADQVELPFTITDLTFKGICYTVRSSITKEDLELLKGVDGIVEHGKMTALMGSSGAGKTTLMDVLALRKSTGKIEGEVRLNGHLQEKNSFRRCAGYVEQFDLQSAQLSIRETCEFSARLRLQEGDPAVTPESIEKFVDQTLSMLELTNIQDLLVGTDETGGLSFEQKKRLSIAVEVVANPSILFLDEPTSGLDARAASIVMRGMKRIAVSGRAVCATIHQPSIAIFNSFDRLLLLKRGGETVFFGDLGEDSQHLISYLERYDATPKIQPGENPATWMLTTIGAGSAATKKQFDYAGSYAQSKLHEECLENIDKINEGATEENKVTYTSKYATSWRTQRKLVLFKEMLVYFRSPSYNVTRVIVSATVALLFSTVYATQRVPSDESDMNSRINSIFIAVIFLAVNAQNTVLAVFENERNMFYRHKAANMYAPRAIAAAMTLAEVPFILQTSTVFMLLFYFIMGFATEADKFFAFWGFFTLNLMAFTYIGQMLVSVFRDSQTAQGFGGLVISMTVMFSGILLRPNQIPPFWIWMYWVMPGHYVFESIIVSQYQGDDTLITASPGSPFYFSLGCDTQPPEVPCQGTAEEWVMASFPSWSPDHIPWNGLYMVILIIATRLITFLALIKFDYRAN